MTDEALGSERHILDMMEIDHHMSVYGNVDFAAVANALGIDGRTVRSPEDLRDLAPEVGTLRTKPLLIDCKVRQDIRARWLEESNPPRM